VAKRNPLIFRGCTDGCHGNWLPCKEPEAKRTMADTKRNGEGRKGKDTALVASLDIKVRSDSDKGPHGIKYANLPVQMKKILCT